MIFFRNHPHLNLTFQLAQGLLLLRVPNCSSPQHSNRGTRTKLACHTNPQNMILCRSRISTGNLQHSGQWLTRQSKNRLENQTSVKSFGHSRVGISGFNSLPISGLVIGGTRVKKIKLSGQKKLFVMFKRGSSQVVNKQGIMYLWVLSYIYIPRVTVNIRNRKITQIYSLRSKLHWYHFKHPLFALTSHQSLESWLGSLLSELLNSFRSQLFGRSKSAIFGTTSIVEKPLCKTSSRKKWSSHFDALLILEKRSQMESYISSPMPSFALSTQSLETVLLLSSLSTLTKLWLSMLLVLQKPMLQKA